VPKWVIQTHLKHLSPRAFQWYKKLFNPMSFDPCNRPLKIWNSLGNVGVHSLTLSYTPESMTCDSRASFLARTFAIPCLSRELKVRVATNWRIQDVFFQIHVKYFHITIKLMEIEKRKVEINEIDLGFCLIYVLYRVLPCGYTNLMGACRIEKNIVE